MTMPGSPRMFALTREEGDGPPKVVGYGMELPDGSALSISWPNHGGATCYSTASADDAAWLRQAEVAWIGDQPKGGTNEDSLIPQPSTAWRVTR